MHGASGKRYRVVVVVVSPRVPLLSLLGGKDEQDLGRKTPGGRCPRGLIKGIFPQAPVFNKQMSEPKNLQKYIQNISKVHM